MLTERVSQRKVLVAASIASSACLRGVARFARENNWHLVADMLYTDSFPRNWKGDGVIAVVAYQTDLLRQIQDTGLPCVGLALTDTYLPFPTIGPDNAEVGRIGADHLVERAYRSFAWAPFIGDAIDRERLAGFEARLAEHGHMCYRLPALHRRIGNYWHDDWVEHRRTLLARLRQLPRPAAIFASNDCVAADLVDACNEAGFTVPEEIAILGAGNDGTLCESVAVPLSSVELDIEGMAFRAATALDALMRGDPIADLTRVPPRGVITRISTDIRAVSNPQVAQALNYIAEHFPEPGLSVAEIAEAIGVSRRHLERSFRTETGSTVHEHIVKRRMQEASRLLRSHPRAKIAAVAQLVGLDGAGSFFRTFRRFFGESPSLHRQGGSQATAETREAEADEQARESA